MENYKRILVAFDGSESSESALRQALALQRIERSEIKVLAVVPVYDGDLDLIGVGDIMSALRGAAEKLTGAASEIARSESAEVETSMAEGEPYEKIVDVCEDEGCDLVVMGRRGLRRIERVLLGSVTSRVISHLARDVLVVPRGAALTFEEVLLATDGSAHSGAALDRALHFAARGGGRLTAVSVVDVYPEFYAEAPEMVDKMEKASLEMLRGVRAKAEAAGVGIETRVLKGNAAEEIVGLAGEIKAGGIFMGSRGRSGLKRLVLGSVAEKVIGLASCPVLVAKAG